MKNNLILKIAKAGSVVLGIMLFSLITTYAYAGGGFDNYGSTVGTGDYYPYDYGSSVGTGDYYPYDYGSTVGTGDYYPYDYGSTVGTGDYYPYDYGSTVGTGDYYPYDNSNSGFSYGCDTCSTPSYTPSYNNSSNPCYDYCSSNNYQPYQPSYQQPYIPPMSYGCGSCFIPSQTYPSYIPPASNNNANSNVNNNKSSSNSNSSSNSSSTSNSSSSASAYNLNNINNTFNPTFNPTNTNQNVFNPTNTNTFNPVINFNPNINNNNPVNVTVNVPRGDNTTGNPNLTAYCVASPNNPLIGTNVLWQVYPSGGTGTYSYAWTGAVSGNSSTESNVYYFAGTQTANVVVYSNGQQVTANCSTFVQANGATVSGIYNYQQPTYYQQPQIPSGTPSAGVYLSQIPATGIKPGMKLALFTLGLLMWSAFAAYMILQKRKLAALSLVGINTSEMDLDTEPTEIADEPMTEAETTNDSDLESNLSFRARENDVLISRDGIEAIISKAGQNVSAAESILSEVISKISRNEGNYATLNGEKVNAILNS